MLFRSMQNVPFGPSVGFFLFLLVLTHVFRFSISFDSTMRALMDGDDENGPKRRAFCVEEQDDDEGVIYTESLLRRQAAWHRQVSDCRVITKKMKKNVIL